MARLPMNALPALPATWRALQSFGPVSDSAVLVDTVRAITDAGVEFDRFGTVDGGERLTFSLDAVAADASGIHEAGTLYLHGSQATATVRTGLGPGVSVTVNSEVTEAQQQGWLELAEYLHGLLSPEFLVAGWGPEPVEDEFGFPTWENADQLDEALLVGQHFISWGEYQRVGPTGLGLRTYLCPHYVELFGDELLEEIPGVVERLPTSRSVRVDVSQQLVGADFDEIRTSWKACMAHLETAQVFATPEISSDDDGKIIEYTRKSERFVRVPKE